MLIPFRILKTACCFAALLFTYPVAFAQLGNITYNIEKDKPAKFKTQILKSEKTGEKKFTFPRRVVQNTASRYNYYFNANNRLNQVIERARISNRDNYLKLLPFYSFSLNNTAAQSGELDSVIYKATAGILLHDLRSAWVDNFYLLIGKAYLLRKDFDSASMTFQFINYNLYPRKKKNDDQLIVGSNANAGGSSISIANKENTNLIKKVFTTPPSRNDAFIWQIRSLTEKQDYGEAAGLINTLENDPNFPNRLMPALQEVSAYWFYKQGLYDSAATHLEKALSNALDQQEKARSEYLLAQLFERSKNRDKASEYYNMAIKHTTDPLLDIFANLSNAKMYNANEPNQIDFSIATLLRMAKKDKFEAYRDIVYYSAGEVALEKPDSAAAEFLFAKSLRYNESNVSFKNKAFLRLGEINFARKKYKAASANYDSLQSVDTTIADLDQILTKRNSLSKIVEQINIIEREDSLQLIALMPAAERESFIKKLAKKLRKERGLKEEENYNLNNPSSAFNNNKNDLPELFASNTTQGDWYFYNASIKSRGFSEFRSRWGKRQNIDNWRRIAGSNNSNDNSNNIVNYNGLNPSLTNSDINNNGLNNNGLNSNGINSGINNNGVNTNGANLPINNNGINNGVNPGLNNNALNNNAINNNIATNPNLNNNGVNNGFNNNNSLNNNGINNNIATNPNLNNNGVNNGLNNNGTNSNLNNNAFNNNLNNGINNNGANSNLNNKGFNNGINNNGFNNSTINNNALNNRNNITALDNNGINMGMTGDVDAVQIVQTYVDSESNNAANSKNNAVVDISFEGMMNNVPTTDEKLKISNTLISGSLFKLGKLYQNSLEDYSTAVETYQTSLKRFPDSLYGGELYLNLSYCYQKLGDIAKANYYKNLLTNKFKESGYAKNILNPKAVLSTEKNPRATKSYENIYNLFIEGQFEKALQEKKVADSLYGQNYWSPQLLYIEAVYYVRQKQDSLAIGTLSNIINTYPNSKLTTRAANLIDVLSRRKEIEGYLTTLQIERAKENEVVVIKESPVINNPALPGTNRQRATRGEIIKKDTAAQVVKNKPVNLNSSFNFIPEDSQYVVMMLDKVDPVYVSEAKNAFNRYNREKFSAQNITIAKDTIDKNKNLLIFSQFANADAAIIYADRLKKNAQSEVSWLPANKYSFFIISDANLQLLKYNKNLQAYIKLLNTKYPGKF